MYAQSNSKKKRIRLDPKRHEKPGRIPEHAKGKPWDHLREDKVRLGTWIKTNFEDLTTLCHFLIDGHNERLHQGYSGRGVHCFRWAIVEHNGKPAMWTIAKRLSHSMENPTPQLSEHGGLVDGDVNYECPIRPCPRYIAAIDFVRHPRTNKWAYRACYESADPDINIECHGVPLEWLDDDSLIDLMNPEWRDRERAWQADSKNKVKIIEQSTSADDRPGPYTKNEEGICWQRGRKLGPDEIPGNRGAALELERQHKMLKRGGNKVLVDKTPEQAKRVRNRGRN